MSCNKLPCPNCILLAACKARYHQYKLAHPDYLEAAINAFTIEAFGKCSLADKYLFPHIKITQMERDRQRVFRNFYTGGTK